MADNLLGDWLECDLNLDWAIDERELAECTVAGTVLPRGMGSDKDEDGVVTFVEASMDFQIHGHPEFGRGKRRPVGSFLVALRLFNFMRFLENALFLLLL